MVQYERRYKCAACKRDVLLGYEGKLRLFHAHADLDRQAKSAAKERPGGR
jgi:hypothetical protein